MVFRCSVSVPFFNISQKSSLSPATETEVTIYNLVEGMVSANYS